VAAGRQRHAAGDPVLVLAVSPRPAEAEVAGEDHVAGLLARAVEPHVLVGGGPQLERAVRVAGPRDAVGGVAAVGELEDDRRWAGELTVDEHDGVRLVAVDHDGAGRLLDLRDQALDLGAVGRAGGELEVLPVALDGLLPALHPAPDVGDVVVRVRLLRGAVRVLVAPLCLGEVAGLVGEDGLDERIDRLGGVGVGRGLALGGRRGRAGPGRRGGGLRSRHREEERAGQAGDPSRRTGSHRTEIPAPTARFPRSCAGSMPQSLRYPP
jgi:hypothetical protein